MIEASDLAMGRTRSTLLSGLLITGVAYWVVGTLFALPALLHVRQWKIQLNRSLDRGALLRAMPLIVFNFVVGSLLASLALLALLPEEAFDWRRLPGTWTLARDAAV